MSLPATEAPPGPLTERYADVDCSVGIHPLDLKPGEAPALDWLLGELNHPRVVAIGETGLDYHYEPEAAELQQRARPNEGDAPPAEERTMRVGAEADQRTQRRENQRQERPTPDTRPPHRRAETPASPPPAVSAPSAPSPTPPARENISPG